MFALCRYTIIGPPALHRAKADKKHRTAGDVDESTRPMETFRPPESIPRKWPGHRTVITTNTSTRQPAAKASGKEKRAPTQWKLATASHPGTSEKKIGKEKKNEVPSHHRKSAKAHAPCTQLLARRVVHRTTSPPSHTEKYSLRGTLRQQRRHRPGPRDRVCRSTFVAPKYSRSPPLEPPCRSSTPRTRPVAKGNPSMKYASQPPESPS